MRWTDPQLAWDPSKFDNIRYITVASEKIWTPDIMLYNTADDESNAHTDYYKTKATIYADGDVMWVAPVTWQVSCSFDVTWFPVDKQSCNMTFGSWTYTFHQVELTPLTKHGGDEDHEHFMIKNGEWKVLETKIHYQNISFSCCDEPFSAVIYEVVISRLSLYYFMYILLPLISLAFLFLMVFFIPYDTERMGFGVTILLSITVYLLVISEELPEKSDDKSMLGICFIIEFYLLCAALALSLLTTNLSRRKTQPSGLLMTLHNKLTRKPIIQSEKPEIELEALNPEKAFTDKILEEKNFNEQWKNVAIMLDKFFFVLVAMLMGIIPIIVTLSLNKSGLGSV
ncbi:neuronal acetylcholine receptor subunit alpha-2-like isoform X2 [Hydractinia symbiolongicarpus]|nr:neuronal acetylcholine receptor subunit alpha-2-like isoform X2 [Hydractinia symbiolongicarpus]